MSSLANVKLGEFKNTKRWNSDKLGRSRRC